MSWKTINSIALDIWTHVLSKRMMVKAVFVKKEIQEMKPMMNGVLLSRGGRIIERKLQEGKESEKGRVIRNPYTAETGR